MFLIVGTPPPQPQDHLDHVSSLQDVLSHEPKEPIPGTSKEKDVLNKKHCRTDTTNNTIENKKESKFPGNMLLLNHLFNVVRTILNECSICKQPFRPSVGIRNCEAGHLICTNCQRKVFTCPVCRTGKFPFKMPLLQDLLEAYTDPSQKFYCLNDECRAHLIDKNLIVHEATCLHRLVPCISEIHGGCEDEIPLWRLGLHIKENNCATILTPDEDNHFRGVICDYSAYSLLGSNTVVNWKPALLTSNSHSRLGVIFKIRKDSSGNWTFSFHSLHQNSITKNIKARIVLYKRHPHEINTHINPPNIETDKHGKMVMESNSPVKISVSTTLPTKDFFIGDSKVMAFVKLEATNNGTQGMETMISTLLDINYGGMDLDRVTETGYCLNLRDEQIMLCNNSTSLANFCISFEEVGPSLLSHPNFGLIESDRIASTTAMEGGTEVEIAITSNGEKEKGYYRGKRNLPKALLTQSNPKRSRGHMIYCTNNSRDKSYTTEQMVGLTQPMKVPSNDFEEGKVDQKLDKIPADYHTTYTEGIFNNLRAGDPRSKLIQKLCKKGDVLPSLLPDFIMENDDAETE